MLPKYNKNQKCPTCGERFPRLDVHLCDHKPAINKIVAIAEKCGLRPLRDASAVIWEVFIHDSIFHLPVSRKASKRFYWKAVQVLPRNSYLMEVEIERLPSIPLPERKTNFTATVRSLDTGKTYQHHGTERELIERLRYILKGRFQLISFE